jgi:hypothetical protein
VTVPAFILVPLISVDVRLEEFTTEVVNLPCDKILPAPSLNIINPFKLLTEYGIFVNELDINIIYL